MEYEVDSTEDSLDGKPRCIVPSHLNLSALPYIRVIGQKYGITFTSGV